MDLENVPVILLKGRDGLYHPVPAFRGEKGEKGDPGDGKKEVLQVSAFTEGIGYKASHNAQEIKTAWDAGMAIFLRFDAPDGSGEQSYDFQTYKDGLAYFRRPFKGGNQVGRIIITIDGSSNVDKADDFITICNPNLLDNWYFANPVNQRGQTKYNGPASYSIDRWKRWDTCNVSLVDNSIQIATANEENNIFEQYMESDLTGKTVTMSAVINGVLYSGQKKVDQYDYTNVTHFPDGQIEVFASGGKTTFRIWVNKTPSIKNVDISAVKLELSTQQTLAHQENGRWVLNEIPDYGEQLRRCQRYYWASEMVFTTKDFHNPTIALCNVQFPVKMVKRPRVKIMAVDGTENSVSYWSTQATIPGVTATALDSVLTVDGFDAILGSSAFGADTGLAFKVIVDANL